MLSIHALVHHEFGSLNILHQPQLLACAIGADETKDFTPMNFKINAAHSFHFPCAEAIRLCQSLNRNHQIIHVYRIAGKQTQDEH